MSAWCAILSGLLCLAPVRQVQTSQPPSQPTQTAPAETQPAASSPASASQPAPSFALARECWLRGDYEQAGALYDSLADGSDDDAVRAACERSEIDRQFGTISEAIARLQTVEKIGRQTAAWNACLAGLLAEVGRYQEAIDHNRRALELNGDDFRARCQLGRLYELLGRPDAALKAYDPFEGLMTDGPLPDRPEDLADLGRGFYRLSVLKRHANLADRTRHVLTEVYQEAFDVIDRQYWPARLAAAELLLEKHNLNEACSDFEAICQQNARVPDAHAGLARIALEENKIELAELAALDALECNPSHVPSLLIMAQVRLVDDLAGDAVICARRALETNPNSVEALALLTAAAIRSGDKAAAQSARQRAAEINPRPALLHHALGVQLAAERQFDEARGQFLKAIEFDQIWPAPRIELGLLYMETGEEALARQALDAAFKLDSFDDRVHGVLALLDQIEKFARLDTAHFTVKYDEAADGVIAPYFAETLERMFTGICETYGAKLDKSTIVEVFPDHMSFSLRTAARPFIATIGACTGPVIVMSAPRRTASSVFGAANWANVLRHEFTHTVTLAATGNRIPRWLTEGLAEREEGGRRSWDTMLLLAFVVRRDELFSLDAIDRAFHRPQRPDDVHRAYAQGEWMVDYIVERYGDRAILGLLGAFREGRTQEQAVGEAMNCDSAAFDKAFKTWAAEQVERWALPPLPAEDLQAIEARLKDRPDDPSLLARLAQAELAEGHLEEAERAAQKSLKRNKREKLALEVFSHALIDKMLREPDELKRQTLLDETEPYIRTLIQLDPDNPHAIKYLGYVAQASRNWAEAIDFLTRYQLRFPADPDSYRRLAGVYQERNDPEEALLQLESLFRLVPNEPAVARRIADLYLKQGRPARAVPWFRRALETELYDADLHRVLGDTLLTLGRAAEAESEFQAVCRLQPDKPGGYEGMSKVCRAMGDAAKAAEYAEKAAARKSAAVPGQ